ncbi:sensor histidine kinase [Nocardioides sp. BGMRC 2183]|nr:sensor histidine kinase [Nocardioides sp. BGMRC 2183]
MTPSAAEPRSRLPAWVVDALLGTAVTVTLAVVISTGQGGRNEPDSSAYLWAAGLGGLMLARRRHPVVVLVVSVLGLFSYYIAGYPAIGVAVPVATALLSAAEFGRLAWAIGAAVVVMVTSVGFRIADGQQLSYVVGYDLPGHLLLMSAAIALGHSIRTRRLAAESMRRNVQLMAEQARQQAEAERREERIAIARDLHDSLGHAISVVSLHADVGREAVGRGDQETARAALRTIRDTTTASMTELRRTVGLLRTEDRAPRSVVALDDLDALKATVPGITVTMDVRVSRDLPAIIDSAAYRIIQEAVTNIVKHATATRATITVRDHDDVLELEVRDDGGPHHTGSPGTGHGITGMRERVTALGGSLAAGPDSDGFRVWATLPLHEAMP